MFAVKNEKAWDKNLQLLLLAIIAFNIIPHILLIPVWATSLAGLFLCWKAFYLFRGVSRPPRWLLWMMCLVATGATYSHYGTFTGNEPAGCILVILASAKLLETNRYRDAMFIIFTSYFLLMTHLLESQTLLTTLYMALDVLLITSLMFHAHKRDRRTSARSFRPVMRMLALALPVWILLFVAFPRFSAGFWNLKQDPRTGTGFSEELNPGAVSKLAGSDALAFRVTFDRGRIPIPELLYWRGAVLTSGNGLQWARGDAADMRDHNVDRELPTNQIRNVYEVSLEPKFKKWLFVLDYPTDFRPSERLSKFGVRGRFGSIIQTDRDLSLRTFYRATSTNVSLTQGMSETEQSILTAVPTSLDPRVLDLANSLREQALIGDPTRPLVDRYSDLVLEYFRAQNFRYTRQPGNLVGTGPEQLARFLFETKRGFCEHYAAAFATLVRLGGFPSRITIGFQGGKINDVDDYLIVRDLDAHAWAEVWREGRDGETGRWVRVDPTSIVSPLRIELGGDFNLLDEETQLAGLSAEDARKQINGAGLLLQFEMVWDATQARWNQFVNNYDFERQQELLQQLGIQGGRAFLWGVVVVGVLLFIFVLNLVIRRRAKREDPMLIAWRNFCAKLEKAGLSKKLETEGPLDFKRRATSKFPERADDINKVVDLFVAMRYGRNANGTPASEFNQSVRRFSIKPSSRSASS